MKQPEVLIAAGDWLTLQETMQRLGKSQRTIQKLVKAKHLKCKHQPRPGRGPEPLYWAKDVERLEGDEYPRKKYEMNAERTKASEPDASRRSDASRDAKLSHALELVNQAGQMFGYLRAEHEAEREERRAEREAERERRKWDREDARERWEAEQKMTRERWEAEQKRLAAQEARSRPWLTLEQAEAEFGLPAAALRQAVKAGKLAATRPGGLRIRRASLEAFAG